ncbi:FUSC family protein [Herbaspirillum lusitanum]|uniref:FUSC family protein n=1 Tax=Herbaspirillum lusitanum TaxID=213312 RepID=A0ABW9ADZ7_9BURK
MPHSLRSLSSTILPRLCPASRRLLQSLSALQQPARQALLRIYRRWDARFPLRNANLSEGLRAACCASSMLLLGEWLNMPLFSWAAIGAFLTCLADSAGSNRARLMSMGGFTLASTAGGMFAATVAGWGMAPGLLAIMCCAGVAGFSRIYGASTGLVLMLAAGVSAIMADSPVVLMPLAHSHVLIYFAGCVWATVLGLTVWRIHPFAPARNAVARVYGALAGLADIAAGHTDHEHQGPQRNLRAHLLRDPPAELAELSAQSRKHVRADIAAANQCVAAVSGHRAESLQLYEHLLVKLARAGALLDCITVLADLRLSPYENAASRRRTGRVLEAIARLLRGVQRELQREGSQARAGRAAADARVMQRLRQLMGRMHLTHGHLLHSLPEPAASAGFNAVPAAGRIAHSNAKPERTHHHGLHLAWRRLKALAQTAALHCSPASAELQHGLRCAAAAGATYLVVHLLRLPFGYWATMATMLVMQPSIADSWSRSMERAIGSVVGGALAVLLCLLIHSPLAFAILVFPLTVLTMALRPVSYGLYATFLTPVFVLVADVAVDPHNQLSNALLRGGNNVIGVLIAILASYLFWPRRQDVNLHGQLSRMILVNLAYLRAALDPQAQAQREGVEPARLMHAQRREACLSNIETGLLLQRMMREKQSGAHQLSESRIRSARTALALSRRLAGAATHIWLSGHGEEQFPALVAWLEQMSGLFERRSGAVSAYSALLAQRPLPSALAQADAVDTVCLLAAAVYPALAESAEGR